MCHWSKGLQIRYNVAQLEQWARDAKVAKTTDSDKEETLEALHPIIQAAVLLQVRKSGTDSQCGNISIFLSLRFYVDSKILENLYFDFLVISAYKKCKKFPKIKIEGL